MLFQAFVPDLAQTESRHQTIQANEHTAWDDIGIHHELEDSMLPKNHHYGQLHNLCIL